MGELLLGDTRETEQLQSPAGTKRSRTGGERGEDDKDAECDDEDATDDDRDDDDRDDDERVGDEGDETEVDRDDPLLYEVVDAESFASMIPQRYNDSAYTQIVVALKMLELANDARSVCAFLKSKETIPPLRAGTTYFQVGGGSANDNSHPLGKTTITTITLP